MARELNGVKYRTQQIIVFAETLTEPRLEILRQRTEVVDTIEQHKTNVVTVTVADLLKVCPEYRHMFRDLPDCIDLYHERMGLDK